jgi:hypothetical protein
MDQKSNINVTVENYFAMWNARDARTRRTLVEEVWTEQARSVDPIAEVVGWDAIDQYVAGEQQKYPLKCFRQLRAVDSTPHPGDSNSAGVLKPTRRRTGRKPTGV